MMIGVTCACMPSLAYSYRHIPAIQSLKKSVSSYFSNFERSKQSTLGGTIGSIGQKFPAIRKTNDIYITMDDYQRHTTGHASQVSQSEMVDYPHRDGSYVSDRSVLPETFDGSGHLDPEGQQSGHSEERARDPHFVL
jgi:hypothetical protein